MDPSVITGMVEDYWRAIIPAMQTGRPEAAADIAERFEQRIEETGQLMQPLEGAAFRQAIEAERERLMHEYTCNPVALKMRLGIDLGIDTRELRHTHRTTLGDVAMRTAVRATVWETVWALFRALRR